MKTKIKQLVMLVLLVVASVATANAQSSSPVDYQALLTAAQAQLAQYQTALTNPNLDPARVAGIQSGITQLQQNISAYQARIASQTQPRGTSASANNAQNQQNPLYIQRQAAEQNRAQKEAALQQQQNMQNNPAVKRSVGRETPAVPK